MEVRPEVLVVVAADADFAALVESLRRVAPVTQALPPRLALVSMSPDAVAPRLPGMTCYRAAPPAAVLDELGEPERLFVSAWVARQAGKTRLGDGASWDAPGRRPPDLPPLSPPERR